MPAKIDRRAALSSLMLGFAALLAGCSLDQRSADDPAAGRAAGRCPEVRTTERAPDNYQGLTNPLAATSGNIDRGRQSYVAERAGGSCASCHGVNGRGDGATGRELNPPPRNFACGPTMHELTDGQLFWVIENGAGAFHLPARQGAQQVGRPGRRDSFITMSGYRQELSDTEIWQLVLYIRTLANTSAGNPGTRR